MDMGIIQSMKKNEEIKGYGKTMLEELVSAILGGDAVALGKLIKDVLNGP